jgi:hypothetical protein
MLRHAQVQLRARAGGLRMGAMKARRFRERSWAGRGVGARCGRVLRRELRRGRARSAEKPRKANLTLGFFARHLGFPWLLTAAKANKSQGKPSKAKLRARVGLRREGCRPRATRMFTDVYVC